MDDNHAFAFDYADYDGVTADYTPDYTTDEYAAYTPEAYVPPDPEYLHDPEPEGEYPYLAEPHAPIAHGSPLVPILVLVLALLIPVAYTLLTRVLSPSLPTLRNKRICLLIAHPDDEAMFFAPTVLALTRPSTGNHVKILCLSTGDADGLGETRRKELVKSAMMLGLRREDDVFVMDDPYVCHFFTELVADVFSSAFPDSMTTSWPADQIANLLFSAFAPHMTLSPPSSPVQVKPPPSIDVLITFDERGISSHTNHISLFHGARAFLKQLSLRTDGAAPHVHLYTLTSVSLVRKFTSVVDVFATLAMSWGGVEGRGEDWGCG